MSNLVPPATQLIVDLPDPAHIREVPLGKQRGTNKTKCNRPLIVSRWFKYDRGISEVTLISWRTYEYVSLLLLLSTFHPVCFALILKPRASVPPLRSFCIDSTTRNTVSAIVVIGKKRVVLWRVRYHVYFRKSRWVFFVKISKTLF